VVGIVAFNVICCDEPDVNVNVPVLASCVPLWSYTATLPTHAEVPVLVKVIDTCIVVPRRPWHTHVLPVDWLHDAPGDVVTLILLTETWACPTINVSGEVFVKLSAGIDVVIVYEYEPGVFGAVKLQASDVYMGDCPGATYCGYTVPVCVHATVPLELVTDRFTV